MQLVGGIISEGATRYKNKDKDKVKVIPYMH